MVVSICPVPTNNGLRIYTNVSDGTIVAEANSTTEKQIDTAQKAHDYDTMAEAEGWFRTGSFECDPDTSMCACTIKGQETLIFYIYNGDLCYVIDDPLPPKHNKPQSLEGIIVPGLPLDSISCMSGSKLAVVANADASKLILFYQDVQGYINRRSANSLIWEDVPERICKAPIDTGIAAVGWSGLKNIRLYCQDEDYNIQEYCGSFDGQWSKGSMISKEPTALTTISVVHWFGKNGSEIRLYYQAGAAKIAERCWGPKPHEWSTGTTISNELDAQYNIQAFIRDVGAEWPVLTVWAATQDRILFQRLYSHYNGWFKRSMYTLPRSVGN